MSALAPGPRGVVHGDPSGLIKLPWIRDRSVPTGHPAPGRLDCPCGNAITGVQFGDGADYPCGRCGRVRDSYGWLVTALAPLAERAARFHAPHPSAVLAERADWDREAWLAYVAWHESVADPASVTPPVCRDQIAATLDGAR